MPRQAWRLVAAALVGLLAVATLGAMSVVTRASNWRMGRFIHESSPQVRSVPLPSGQTLTVDVTRGAGVSVVAGTAGSAQISATMRWFGGAPGAAHLVWSLSAGRTGPVVRVGVEPVAWFVVGFAPEAQVRVQLPAAASLVLTEDNGPVRLTGVHAGATLQVANGGIDVSGWTGPLRASDANGRIAVIGSAITGDLSLTNRNGQTAVSGTSVSGNLAAHTTNGSLVLTRVRLGGTFDLTSANGAIRYSGTGGSGGQAFAGNGSVQVAIAPPAAGGYYAVSTPHGHQDWPPGAAAPQLGSITLQSANGSAEFLGGGAA